jgi:3'(2'), 5'-bisphosphate nucleotidase
MAAVISRSHRSAILDEIFKFIGLTNEITSGSSGIKLGLISEAKAELMLSASAGYKIWDICAPEAILVGAGGKVTDFTGAAISYQSEEQRVRNGILASNGHKHDELADILQKMVKLPFAKP